jgi:hypothetical protein
MRRISVIGLMLLASAGQALACSMSEDFKPPTEITTEDLIFVGSVTAETWAGRTFTDRKELEAQRALCYGLPEKRDPKCLTNTPSPSKPGMVMFTVEAVGRGEVADIVVIPQGGGGDCSIQFDLGKRYFFAGTFIFGMTRLVAPGDPAGDILKRFMP